MLVNSQFQHRIKTLSSYIASVSDNVNASNYANASAIVTNNKHKILQTVLAQYSPEKQLFDSIQMKNDKLKQQIETLTKRKQQLLQSNHSIKLKQIGFKAGVPSQDIKVACLRFKVTLNDASKMQFDQATLSGDFDTLNILNNVNNSRKTLNFMDFLLVQKKNIHVLLEYETKGSRNYVVFQCQDLLQALRVFRSLSFGKLIRENRARKDLFDPDDQKSIKSDEQQLIKLSDTISKPSRENMPDKSFDYNLQNNKSRNNYLHQSHFLRQANASGTQNPPLNSSNLLGLNQNSYQYHHRKSVQNFPKMPPNRARTGTQNNVLVNQLFHHSMLGPMTTPRQAGLRKHSEDLTLRKINVQPFSPKQELRRNPSNSFDQSNSHPSSISYPAIHITPENSVSPPKLEPNILNSYRGKRINQKYIEKDLLIASFGPQDLNNTSNWSLPRQDTNQTLAVRPKNDTNWNNIEEREDQYRSRSSINNEGLQFRKSRDSKDEVSIVDHRQDENFSAFQAPILRNTNDPMLESNEISERSENMELSSPKFPSKVVYTNSGNDVIKPIPVSSSQQQQDNRQKKDSDTGKDSSGPHQSDQQHNEVDHDEFSEQQEDDQFEEHPVGEQTPEDSEASITSDQRRQFLQIGVTLTKCSPDGFNTHDKRVYLSQNEIELVYQDLKDKKKKNISLNDIEKVQYPGYGNGIKKHVKIIDQQKCMKIKVKPCKATGHKQKVLEFIGKSIDQVLKFATYLDTYIQNAKN